MTLPFSKEVIAEAIKAVLAEGSKTVIVGNPSQTAQDIMNDPDVDSTAKKTAVDTIKKGMKGDKVEVPTKSMEEDHHLDPNDESDMAKVQLINICKYSQELIDMIPDGTQLDAWVQDKLSIAFDYIDTIKHYLEGEEYLAATEAPAEEDLAESDFEARTKEDLVFQYLRDAWQFGALKGKDVNPDEELSAMADSLLTYLPDYDSAELDEATKEEFKAKKKGQTITYNGQDYVVDSNDGIVITAKGEDGKVKHINLGMAKSGMNEEDVYDTDIDDKQPSKKDLKAAEKETGGKRTHFTPEAQKMHDVIKIKVGKIEKKIEDKQDYKLDLAALKQYISKPEVRKVLGANHIKGMVSSIIGETLTEGVSCCGRCGRVHESSQECKKPYISKSSPKHCSNKK